VFQRLALAHQNQQQGVHQLDTENWIAEIGNKIFL